MASAVARRSVMAASRMASTTAMEPTVSILELAKQDLNQQMKKAKVRCSYKRRDYNPRTLIPGYFYTCDLNFTSSLSVSAPAVKCPVGTMGSKRACSARPLARGTGTRSYPKRTSRPKNATSCARTGFLSKGIHGDRKGHNKSPVVPRKSRNMVQTQGHLSKCLFAYGFGLPSGTGPKCTSSKRVGAKMAHKRRRETKSRIPVFNSGISKPKETYSFMWKRFGYVSSARKISARRQSRAKSGHEGGLGIVGGTRYCLGNESCGNFGMETSEERTKAQANVANAVRPGQKDGFRKKKDDTKPHSHLRKQLFPTKGVLLFDSNTTKGSSSTAAGFKQKSQIENRLEIPHESWRRYGLDENSKKVQSISDYTDVIPRKEVPSLDNDASKDGLNSSVIGSALERCSSDVKSVESPDGSWEGYEDGEESRRHLSLNHPIPVAARLGEKDLSLAERRSRLENDLDALLESMEKTLGSSLFNSSCDRQSHSRKTYEHKRKCLTIFYQPVFEAVI